MRARLAADEKASIDAKDNVRLEMARIGREADLARQAAVMQRHMADVKQNAAIPDNHQKAKHALIADQQFNQPYYWAPFILIGH